LGRLDARSELPALVVGTGMTAVVVLGSTRYGAGVGLASILALALFVATTICFLAAPHLAVAITIPLFAVIPVAKVLVASGVGPVKDAVTLSAALATALHVLQKEGRQTLDRIDRVVLAAIGLLVALYVLNAGGLYSESWHGDQWLQGVRLVTEPLILLLAGLLLPRPTRTVAWAAASLVATGCVVALVGITQQLVGAGRLVGFGYSYDQQLTTIGGFFRSFGTLDDAFAYAAFLFLALVTVVFWMRRGALAVACGALIGVGIGVSFVQTAAVILGALLALWMVRAGHTAAGFILFAAAACAVVALTIATAPATQSRTVRAGPSTYLTLNGRTSVWATVFADESKVPLGLGVGAVGRAAERAQRGISDVSGSPDQPKVGQIAVDSGYFAAVADIGIVGFAALLLLLLRLLVLARRATKVPGNVAGWLCMGYLTVMILDASTRDSFTGFPNAYLGYLLVGITLAATREEDRQHRPAVSH
jgi:hypothetical protein